MKQRDLIVWFTKGRLLGLLMVVFCTASRPLNAQFIQFSFYVDTEVAATVVQELDFGELQRNSINEIPVTGTRSGWFQLAVLNASALELDFQLPEFMILDQEADSCETDDCRFPVEIGFSYFVDSSPDQRRSDVLLPLANGMNYLNLPELRSTTRSQNSEYIYININVYGRAIVGDVRAGLYTGEIRLGITY
jgi:hypothetical protein